MAEEQKKRRSRRAYLDDFQKTASGEYVYNGKLHYYQSEHMGRKKAIFVLWLLTVGAMVVLGLPQDVVRWVLVGELALCMGLTFIRQTEILASQCGVFLSFLYLCALEIIPVTGLVSVLMLVC